MSVVDEWYTDKEIVGVTLLVNEAGAVLEQKGQSKKVEE